jgi:hypothetical protein
VAVNDGGTAEDVCATACELAATTMDKRVEVRILTDYGGERCCRWMVWERGENLRRVIVHRRGQSRGVRRWVPLYEGWVVLEGSWYDVAPDKKG